MHKDVPRTCLTKGGHHQNHVEPTDSQTAASVSLVLDLTLTSIGNLCGRKLAAKKNPSVHTHNHTPHTAKDCTECAPAIRRRARITPLASARVSAFASAILKPLPFRLRLTSAEASTESFPFATAAEASTPAPVAAAAAALLEPFAPFAPLGAFASEEDFASACLCA